MRLLGPSSTRHHGNAGGWSARPMWSRSRKLPSSYLNWGRVSYFILELQEFIYLFRLPDSLFYFSALNWRAISIMNCASVIDEARRKRKFHFCKSQLDEDEMRSLLIVQAALWQIKAKVRGRARQNRGHCAADISSCSTKTDESECAIIVVVDEDVTQYTLYKFEIG